MGLAQGHRYLIVGCLNTAVGYGVFGVGVWLGLPHQVALVLNYLIGGLNSYLWNRFWTFRATGSHLRQIPRFMAVTVGVYGVNALLLEGLVRLGLHALLAQLICLVVTTVLGFFAHRLWTFGRSPADVPRSGQV